MSKAASESSNSTTMKEKILLSVVGVTKTFGETVALRNVDFNLQEGEVHCLVGENGAGKSTLIKVLSGAVEPDKGSVNMGGRQFSQLHPDEAMNLGIATIYQDVELIDSLTVADNIFLGHEIRNRIGMIDYKKQFESSRELMDGLNIDIPEKIYVYDLTSAQKQTLQIVKALHIKSQIMIMDEPTSALGRDETEALMNLVRRLAEQGIGVIYISHYLEEVFKIGDRITVLKDGEVVDTYQVSDVNINKVATAMVGRSPSTFYNRERTDRGETVLEVKSLSRQGVVRDVSFDVHRGEVFGIGGMVGAGRTELMSLIFGSDQYDEGSILIDGKKLQPRSPRDAIDAGICMIVEDRQTFGLFMDRPVGENISIVHNEKKGLLLDRKEEQDLVNSVLDRFDIVTAGPQQLAGYLSGGNQQKALVARWFLLDTKVYIFDEPTKGVDIGAKEEIYEFIVELAKNGKAIIMVSSDMPELLSMSDRIGVMRSGKMVTILESDDASEEVLLGHYLGINDNEGERG